MQLTRGQKEALARKAESLIASKKESKKEELLKSWKADKKVTELRNKLVPVQKALVELSKAIKAAGLTKHYSGFVLNNDVYGYLGFSWNDENPERLVDVWTENIKNNQVDAQLKGAYPDYTSIMDELELQCLDKTFDLDSFLAKYRNL